MPPEAGMVTNTVAPAGSRAWQHGVRNVSQMARWLCRLTLEEIRRGRGHFSLIDGHGVHAWVLCGFSLAELSEGPSTWLSLLPVAAPFVLELNDELLGSGDASTVEDALQDWKEHPQALRWNSRLLILVHAVHPPRINWEGLMLQVCKSGDPCTPGWDGLAEHVPETSSDYRQFLQRAHGRRGTGGWLLIPAVRALTPQQETRWSHASADLYREWLHVCGATSDVEDPDAQGLVLLESWDGHRRWFPQEEAPPDPVTSSRSLPARERRWGTAQSEHWALMVHGFYLDRLEEMLAPLLPVQQGNADHRPIDLYVSTPLDQLPQAAWLLQRLGWRRVRLFGVDNRGRDVAPFLLNLLPAALAIGHQRFVKVHTKRSPHLVDGDRWAAHLFGSLLTPDALSTIDAALEQDASLALLAPAGTLLPMALHLDRNVDAVRAVLAGLRQDGSWALNQNFIGGSMMAGRLEAIASWTSMVTELDSFEYEKGQTDGTLAHGLERSLCLELQSRGWRIAELDGDESAIPPFGFLGLTLED